MCLYAQLDLNYTQNQPFLKQSTKMYAYAIALLFQDRPMFIQSPIIHHRNKPEYASFYVAVSTFNASGTKLRKNCLRLLTRAENLFTRFISNCYHILKNVQGCCYNVSAGTIGSRSIIPVFLTENQSQYTKNRPCKSKRL